MAFACHAANVDFVILTQPTLYKESLSPEETARLPRGADDAMRKGLDLYNEEIRSECPRSGARLVDMASLVGRDLEHMKDDIHFSNNGASRFREVFIREVFNNKAVARTK
jgi:hypothetical protein